MDFIFKEVERKSLEPLPKVMKWGFFGNEKDDKKEVLLECG